MLITLTNISKSFGEDTVLKNIKMTINEKGRYGLIGVNGAGKSTLLKIIMEELTFESKSRGLPSVTLPRTTALSAAVQLLRKCARSLRT
ncbi:MAG: ATP-binding cassette domain-containing protein [Clostridia bacterium]|nr:ATP-binding cassette domain-containing protein [Clostridia bacterium]